MSGRSKAPLAFRCLLALFPRPFRDAFGGEMREVFDTQIVEARRQGTGAMLALWLRTASGMIGAAWRERRGARARRSAGLPWYEILASDVRLAGRLLLRSPVFAAVVVSTVAIGIAGVATVFSALNAIVLRPLPGTDHGGRLVLIDRRTSDASEGISASYRFYRHVTDHARTLDGVAAWSKVSLSIARGGRGFAAAGNVVSGNYFSVLGVRPAAGRFFLPEEDGVPLAHAAIVLSYGAWQRELGGDPAVVGSIVTVNGREYHLVGVAPEGFRGAFTPIKIDAWVPLAMQPHVHPARDLQDTPWLWLFGRVRPDTTLDRVRAELGVLATQWVATGVEPPGFRRYTNMRLTPLTGLPDDARQALLLFGAMLLGAALLVTLIAGANVATLLTARAMARRREIGVRVALGATRGRLVRQLLTETLILFALGAFGATAIASIATSALERLPLPADAGLSLELSPDGRVLAVSIAVALLLGAIFGAGPALRGVGRAPERWLRATSPGAGRRSIASRIMIVVQVACSLVLLTAAGLFLRSLTAAAALDLRLDPRGVVVATINTEAFGYDAATGRAFFRDLQRRLAVAPGVERAAFGTLVPLTFDDSKTVVTLDTTAAGGPRKLVIRHAMIDAGYLDVLKVPLVAGRDFNDTETSAAAIVNETFAHRAWPGADALGRTLVIGDRRVVVVGVARDSRYVSLDETPVPVAYTPTEASTTVRTLFVRGRAGAPPPASLIAGEMTAIDPSIPPPVVSTLTHEMSIALLPQRVAAMVTGALGAAGLLLAAVGLYGLVSYAVSLRTREIGVRMALGARTSAVVGLVLSGSMRLIAAGAAIGLCASVAASRLLARYLVAIGPFDPMAFAGAAAVLICVTAAASYLPARRAARVSPLEAMRVDE
jgi:predicted permease